MTTVSVPHVDLTLSIHIAHHNTIPTYSLDLLVFFFTNTNTHTKLKAKQLTAFSGNLPFSAFRPNDGQQLTLSKRRHVTKATCVNMLLIDKYFIVAGVVVYNGKF